jgi:hypothetical protein
MTLEISDAFLEIFGRRPYCIFNNLHRSKMDANRDLPEAAEGNVEASQAWGKFQHYISKASSSVSHHCGRGIYFDVHGQAHQEQWIEWGFLLTKGQLDDNNDAELDSDRIFRDKSSIRTLANNKTSGVVPSFADIIRGPRSIAGLLSSGYRSVPSPQFPGPSGGGYFSGGYNTQHHGSLNGGVMDGIQMEVNSHLRINDAEARRTFTRAFAKAVGVFMMERYRIDLSDHTSECIPQTVGTETSKNVSVGLYRAWEQQRLANDQEPYH